MKLKDQKYGYNETPPKKDLEILYKKYTLEEIGKLYGTYKSRVRKWFRELDIPINQQGGGNNRKFDHIKTEELIYYVRHSYTNKEISDFIGCSVSNVCRLLKSRGIKRNYQKSEYHKYCSRVRRLTEKTYVENKELLNPNNFPRTLCGVEGGYQIDHLKSVRYCFDNDIPAEKCADISNLEFVPWEVNLKRRYKND